MGKKLKTGKSRKDKFYHLAKETGFRSRAAFKLIQLNRKFEFLQRSNVVIDLCAAPGGWLQVVAENAPMSNHIIGVDLVSIPPIRNVKTLQEDITTEKCRQALKKELHTVKADLVLNDGAPNVGKNWLHDAYQQAELTLHALKLATEFLRKGGWFVTKMFRSKDYDAIMWVFKQLFKQVHATKPPASRNESAEIFVVCQNFEAPNKIDPKFLDPKYVFSEVETAQRLSIDLIHPEKKRRQREGYPEGDYTLFHSVPASKFVQSDDFMEMLAQASEITLDTDAIKNHPATTAEVQECIKDIKVLGKKEIKHLFNWRKKLFKALEEKKDTTDKGNKEEKEPEEEMDEETTEDAEMQKLDKLLEEKNMEELRAMKRAKKKVHKAMAKQQTRIDLKMTIPGDKPDIQDDINMFDITRIRTSAELTEIGKGDLSHLDGDDIFEDSDDDGLPHQRERTYFDRDEKKYTGIGEDTDEEEEMEEEPMFEEEEEEDDQSEEDVPNEKKENLNPLIVDMGVKDQILKEKKSGWFKKSVFADLENDDDEDVELEQMRAGMDTREESQDKETKKLKSLSSSPERKKDKEDSKKKEKKHKTNVDEMDQENDVADEEKSGIEDDSDDDSDSDYDFDKIDGKKGKKRKRKDRKERKIVGGIEVVPTSTSNLIGLDSDMKLDAEGLAIGTAMVSSRKRRREVLDGAYHRNMFDDTGLPDWFVVDEKRHMKRHIPVSKEEIEEFKLKKKAVDAQPIKKIAEAKARKKQKILKRTEKARKKANAVTDTIDTSEKEKWQQIKQIYKKAGLLNKAKKKVTYVVSKKGAGKKVRRPAGVKGQFKVVDGRMKKDVRGMQRAEQRNKGKGGGKGGKKRSARR